MASHSEVAHAWANKTGKQCNGRSMYYRGDTIYSYGYHFPIGKHVTLPDGSEAVLLTTSGYSVSTAKHIGIVWHAVSHLKMILCENIEAEHKEHHKKNYVAMTRERLDILGQASRARTYKEMHLAHAERLRMALNEYSKTFRLGFRAVPNLDKADLGVEIAKIKEADRIALVKRQKMLLKREAEREARAIETLSKWQQGENVHCPHIPNRGDFVRVKGDEIRTSKGSRVPLADGLKLFKLMQSCADLKKSWIPPKGQKISDFTVNGIDEHGTLIVACHTIPLENAIAGIEAAGISL